MTGRTGRTGAKGATGKTGRTGRTGVKGVTGMKGRTGITGPAGQNAAISSIFLWTNTSQVKTMSAGVNNKFQAVSFEQTPLGPPGSGWSVVGGSGDTQFTCTQSGWYLMTYKVDVRTNSAGVSPTPDYTRAAAALMKNNMEITGSGSAAQAPDTSHMYSISNTVLVQYTAGENIGVQWWMGYYSAAAGGTVINNVTGLSLGPNQSPWITADFDPSTLVIDPFVEAMASLVITRIVSL